VDRWIDVYNSPLKLSLSTPTIKEFEASGATEVNLKLNSGPDKDQYLRKPMRQVLIGIT